MLFVFIVRHIVPEVVLFGQLDIILVECVNDCHNIITLIDGEHRLVRERMHNLYSRLCVEDGPLFACCVVRVYLGEFQSHGRWRRVSLLLDRDSGT